ncbi:MAG: phage tail tube protein [Oscillospiraceae bacterium]
MSRISANNTKMFIKKSGATEYTELEYLMEVPEFGGTPEKIDVTVLSDKVKKFINGITDLGDFIFKFLYDNSLETSNYRVLKGIQDKNEIAGFKITYPDQTSHEFSAQVSVKMDAGAINGALTFSCNMNVQSDIVTVNPKA